MVKIKSENIVIRFFIRPAIWIIGIVFSLVLLALILVNFTSIQNKIVDRVERELQGRTGAQVRIERFAMYMPHAVSLKGVYAEDAKSDTLIYIGRLHVSTNLFDLLHRTITLNRVGIANARLNLRRQENSENYNYQFIIDSLSGEAKKPETKAPWNFTINRVRLNDVHFVYDDRLKKQYGNFIIGDLGVSMNRLDLTRLDLDAAEINLDNSDIFYSRYGPSESTDDDFMENKDKSPKFNIEVDEISLSKNMVEYHDSVSNMMLSLSMGNLSLSEGKLNLDEQLIDASEFLLNESNVIYEKYPSAEKNSQMEDATRNESSEWRFRLKDLQLDHNSIRYDDNRFGRAARGMDMNHFEVKIVRSGIQNIRFDSLLVADITEFSIIEKDGIHVEELSGNLSYSKDRIEVSDFYFKTPASRIEAEKVTAGNFSTIGKMDAVINLTGSVNTNDLTYIIPSIRKHLHGIKNVSLNAAASKTDQLISLKKLDLNTGGLRINARGTVSEWTDLKKLKADSVQIKLRTGRSALISLMPPEILPEGLTYPEDISLNLNVSGKIDSLEGIMELNTSLGGIDSRFTQGSSVPGDSIQLRGHVSIKEVRLDTILGNPDLGEVTAGFDVSARGNSIKDLSYQVDGAIQSFGYRDFIYKDLELSSDIEYPHVKLRLSADQPEIVFNFDGEAHIMDSFPSVAFRLDLEKADFDALNIGPSNLFVQGLVDADIDSIQIGRLNGTLDIKDVAILKGEELYEVDSLLLISVDQQDESRISIESDILSFQLNGNVPVLKIPSVMTGFANRYLDKTGAKQASDTSYWLNFNLDLHRHDILTDVLIPPLQRLDIERFEGNFDESEDLLRIDIDVPEVQYGSITLNSLTARVESGPDRIDGQLLLNELRRGDVSVSGIKMKVATIESRVRTSFEIPRDDTTFLLLTTDFFREDERLSLHVVEDSLYLNGRHWRVNPDNRLRFGTPLLAENFEFSYSDQTIGIRNAQNDNRDSVVVIEISNFRLAALGDIFDLKNPLFNGLLNLAFTFEPGVEYPSGNLGISNLTYKGTRLGDLSSGFRKIDYGINLDMELSAGEGLLTVKGDFLPESGNELDLTADFRNFNLTALKPITDPVMKSFKGQVDGGLIITGNTSYPGINGDLQLNDIEAFPFYLNTGLYINNETVRFRGDEIRFDSFRILDANESEALLGGVVNTDNFSGIDLDLTFNSNNFRVFDTEEAGDNIFYGKVIVSSDLLIRGSPQLLQVEGNSTLNNGSEVNIVVPGATGEVIEREGLVNFIDRSESADPFFEEVEKISRDTAQQTIEGLDIQANVEINQNTKLTLIIDKRTGDHLSLQGTGNFSFRLRPGGNVNLTGRYNINDGQYSLNFHQVVKRRFSILSGSFIQWTGNPTTARLEIDAQYALETQVPVTDVRERLPFNVNLNIGGELLSPELNFSIRMPEDARQQHGQVAAYINDINRNESELNKQVMSLILFKSFWAGQKASDDRGLGLTSTARTSLSRFLTQQLNRLSTGVEGLNINLNLESYERQTEEQTREAVTNLEVGLSQSLFNERMTIKVSGDVYLERAQSRSRDMLDYADDVSIEYKLTPGGNLQLVGFRENEFDGLSQGEITRTGIGVIYVEDYDNLRELFRKAKENKKKKED